MIAANVEAAKFLLAARDPRAVPHPRRARRRTSTPTCSSSSGSSVCACRRGPRCMPRDFTALLKKSASVPIAALLESVLLRTQSLAVYSPGQHRPLRPGAGGLRAFHFADPPLSRPAGASRDQARAGRRQAGRLPLCAARHGGAGAAVLRARAPRRRSRARSRRALPRGVDGEARRRRVRRHDQRRHHLRPVRRAGRFQGQRPDPRHPVAQRLSTTSTRSARRWPANARAASSASATAVRIIVLHASVEDRKIDFRLVEERGANRRRRRGKPAKRVKQKY